MSRAAFRQDDGKAGFTLIETLVALLLMGLVLSSLATLTAQWLPNWHRGLDRIQRSERIGVALERIADDLAAAEFVPVRRGSQELRFDGSELSVTFVRTSAGPNSGPGLDEVRIGETAERQEFLTVRSRAALEPLPDGTSLSEQRRFGDPVVLLRAPYRLTFAYAGEDQLWKPRWQNAKKLPALIRLTVRDAASQRELSISTVVRLHVQIPASCAGKGGSNCNSQGGAEGQQSPDGHDNAGNAAVAATGAL